MGKKQGLAFSGAFSSRFCHLEMARAISRWPAQLETAPISRPSCLLKMDGLLKMAVLVSRRDGKNWDEFNPKPPRMAAVGALHDLPSTASQLRSTNSPSTPTPWRRPRRGHAVRVGGAKLAGGATQNDSWAHSMPVVPSFRYAPSHAPSASTPLALCAWVEQTCLAVLAVHGSVSAAAAGTAKQQRRRRRLAAAWAVAWRAGRAGWQGWLAAEPHGCRGIPAPARGQGPQRVPH